MTSLRKAKKHLDIWSRYHYRYRHLCPEDGPILVHRGDRRAWDRYARAASNARKLGRTSR